MEKDWGQLTVFFEDPFWVGIFERVRNGRMSVAKVTFGAEPSDEEIFLFCFNHYQDLSFSPAVPVSSPPLRVKVNPKRIIREARKEMGKPISTKSQLALSLGRDFRAEERKALKRAEKEREEEEEREKRQQKKKERHRGK